MKYCRYCGNELFDEAVMCPKCGCMVQGAIMDQSSYGFAIAGFVLSFFGGILGIVFSAIGLTKSKYLNGKGKGLSIAGVIIGSVVMLAGIITIAFI